MYLAEISLFLSDLQLAKRERQFPASLPSNAGTSLPSSVSSCCNASFASAAAGSKRIINSLKFVLQAVYCKNSSIRSHACYNHFPCGTQGNAAVFSASQIFCGGLPVARKVKTGVPPVTLTSGAVAKETPLASLPNNLRASAICALAMASVGDAPRSA